MQSVASNPHFSDRLSAAINRTRTPGVVGLDPLHERLPAELRTAGDARGAVREVELFCQAVIEAVAPAVPAVKINAAFFEAFYDAGLAAYYRLVAHAHAHGLLVIGDVKRGDIGSTARLYARAHLGRPTWPELDPASIPDAVTVAGYLGANAIQPFIDIARQEGKGLYVLVRPSDPGADAVHEFGGASPFYEHMARLVDRLGAADGLIGPTGYSCVGAVVAPKDAESTSALRRLLPHTPFLVPGYGAQGATAAACRACFKPDGTGAVVNASRSVIYAYETPAYAERYGTDWRACIAQAGRDFAADVAALAGFK
jgi:orotidine-5'-phosphate decarboxylase